MSIIWWQFVLRQRPKRLGKSFLLSSCRLCERLCRVCLFVCACVYVCTWAKHHLNCPRRVDVKIREPSSTTQARLGRHLGALLTGR